MSPTRQALVVFSLVSALGLVSSASASSPQITDIAGDANGLNAVDQEHDSRPASYDPGDLRYVSMETTYQAIPVGEDGIHYEPTGLAVHLGTTAVPEVPDTSMFGVYRLDATVQGHSLHLDAQVLRDPGEPTRVTGAHIDVSDGCLNAAGPCTRTSKAAWTAAIDQQRREVVLHFPFASLEDQEAELLAMGVTLEAPRGEMIYPYRWTSILVLGATIRVDQTALIDATPRGADFVIGSDIPADVPCTRGCP